MADPRKPVASALSKDRVTRRVALGCLAGASFAPYVTAAQLTRDPMADPYITPSMFGAAGDGRTDDTAAIEAALATQRPVDWLGLHYRVTSPLRHTITRDLIWRGHGATITFDPAAHAECGLRISDAAGLSFFIENMIIDGAKMANKPLEVLNNTSMTTASTFVADNLNVTGARRSDAFSGGDGILIRGAFDSVTFNGGKVWDCELPEGQGTRSIIGVTGITVMHYSATAFVRQCLINGIEIEKIYSSDPDYQYDQDGVRFFGPDDTGPSGKADTTLMVSGQSSFRNCYGRSIKTQCRSTIVQSSSFMRDRGLTSGAGNVEIDAQTGSLYVKDLEFSYSNKQQPTACVRVIGATGYGAASLTARGCRVFVEDGTTLKVFASTYDRSAKMARHLVADIAIRGAVEMPVEMLVNGPANFMEISNFDLDEIAEGETGERALVYVRRTGSVTPAMAAVTAYGNIYRGGDTVLLLRDAITGVWASATLSAWDNHGFAERGPVTASTTQSVVPSGASGSLGAGGHA